MTSRVCLWCKEAEGAEHLKWCPRWSPPLPPEPELVLLNNDLPYVYRWTRDGRHKQRCRVLKRAKDGECLIEFADGHRFTTNRQSLRKRKDGE